MSKYIRAAAAALTVPLLAFASSLREAPNIARFPRLDGTDFYMFNSYDAGRGGYVAMLANYIPLQDSHGGPNHDDHNGSGSSTTPPVTPQTTSFTAFTKSTFASPADGTPVLIQDISFDFDADDDPSGLSGLLT
jgi:hypothetical protein